MWKFTTLQQTKCDQNKVVLKPENAWMIMFKTRPVFNTQAFFIGRIMRDTQGVANKHIELCATTFKLFRPTICVTLPNKVIAQSTAN